jgi:hypothetical protein
VRRLLTIVLATGMISAGIILVTMRPHLELPEPLPILSLGYRVDRACPDRAADDYFFPVGRFIYGDAFVRHWYSDHLRAMQEHSLSCGDEMPPETYRFLWLRSFRAPIAVTVVAERDGGARLTAARTNGRGGYGPGEVVEGGSESCPTANGETFGR